MDDGTTSSAATGSALPLEVAALKMLPWPAVDTPLLRAQACAFNMQQQRVVVAIDDDPTGCQTVHGVPVVTAWDSDMLQQVLQSGAPAVYVLTNSRALPEAEAVALTQQVGRALIDAAKITGRRLAIVSRSDSTLRGHFPAETDALAEVFAAAGEPFDGVCLIPCFPEGGRHTLGGVHFVRSGGTLLPAAQTPYARDATFGYCHSRLSQWVQEKTAGRIPASSVRVVGLEVVRAGPEALAQQLVCARGGQVIAIDSVDYGDLDLIAAAVRLAEERGTRLLMRTSGAYVKSAAGIADRELLQPSELLSGPGHRGGLVVFGSHVDLSSRQLEMLLQAPNVHGVEVDASAMRRADARGRVVQSAAVEATAAVAAGTTAVVYTSRKVIVGADREHSLAVARQVGHALVEIVRRIDAQPGFVVGKGGITSHELATHALGVRVAQVQGQILPGVPVWQTGPESRWPGVPLVIFPGNVGEAQSVAQVVRQYQQAMEKTKETVRER